MAVMQILKAGSAVRASSLHSHRARTHKHCARRTLLTRAEGSENGASTPSTSKGTIFYGGNSYTAAEWEEALSKGSVAAPTPASSMAQNAVTNSTLDSFVEAMAFSGPAPEIINGRLAMVGFVTAIAAELSSGESVLKQWSEAQSAISLTFLVFIAASLIPIFKNNKDASMGPFTAAAELLNGRAAMIGFASLLLVELTKGSALL